MTIRSEDRTLGEYVRRRRTANGLSLSEAARRSGLDFKYWSKVELGELRSPNPRYLSAIARALEVAPEDLYGLAGYDLPQRLPSLTPYLRAKYDLPPEAIADLEKYFALLRNYYNIPADRPVFPPSAKSATKRPARRRPSKQARNRADHPWRSS